jgi:hypothetical protein
VVFRSHEMAPIKSSITRVLRTQNLASRRVVLSSANRGLTRIVPEFTPIQCTVKLQPTPFESSGAILDFLLSNPSNSF